MLVPHLRGRIAARPRHAGAAGPALVAAAAFVLAGCGLFAGPTAIPPQPVVDVRVGSLCTELPQGSAPGGPVQLLGEPAYVALTWIPVASWFEAATRAAGMDADLDAAAAITILAPVDEAFSREFSEQSRDDLLLKRQDELRDLLEAHVIVGQYSLADLRAAGELETLAGDRRRFEELDDGLTRFDGIAETLCGDYQVANARIHVIDVVLGELPEHEPGGVDEH